VVLHDPVLFNDWHPVALAAGVPVGGMAATQLLDTALLLWRDSAGTLHAWEDRCPHRGMKLSMGTLQNDTVRCAYHGWQYGASGQCKAIPALPQLKEADLKACVTSYPVQERYGLAWVCLGQPAQDPPPFPEFDDARLRKVWCGPYEVRSSGPRIVENFLDLAHLPHLHTGILGELDQSTVRDYRVESFDDPLLGQGIRAVDVRVWQPQANASATEGSDVDYTYRVLRPLTAILTKEPKAQDGCREAIALLLQPVNETLTRAWFILAMNLHDKSDDELRAFQDTIFSQDQPIVENQLPLRLPLSPQAEVSVACDRMSLAYRRYLSGLGLRYGVIEGATL
jgi:phenylpropionate dioxygenase-like ring-hydroxylating dioxygenase large terminal subunit